MILSILTGGIDLPKLSTEVASLRLAVEETNAALADHIVKANARMTTIERVQSDNTAQCQIRMNGLQNVICTAAALAEDVETLKQRIERAEWRIERPTDGTISTVDLVPTLGTEVAQLIAANAKLHVTVAGLQSQIDALTAAKLSEVKARKAPKKSG